MNALILRPRLYMDIDAAAVFAADNINIGGRIPSNGFPVFPDIVSARRHAVKIRHLFQKCFQNLIH